jgi:hypothetical protein
MTNPDVTAGSVWRLRHGDQEVARLTVTEPDMPLIYAKVDIIRGFEGFRPLFREQERAFDEEDRQRADACHSQIRGALTLMFPDGRPVPEFTLRIYDDGTAGWRWDDDLHSAV